MHLVNCRVAQEPRLGVLEGDEVWLPGPGSGWPASLLALIAEGPAAWRGLRPGLGGRRVALAEVELLAPIPRPPKNVICLGLNYADHAAESAAVVGRTPEAPRDLVVFTKAPTAIIGPFAEIPYDPAVSEQLDWEAELGVVIGVGGRGIAEPDALRHVFGYTVINDLSARDLQFRHQQFFIGKSLDGACPMGPGVVTADAIADPQALAIRCWVNGVLKQDSNTRHQISSVARTIATLSRGMTLEPGDIISTGTPSGVGFARQPPEFLRPGDVVECEVEGIGRLRNRVVRRTSMT
jgi:2-keto-4-pentenoate hydratase/2-oxohepta-3-ene-1,7-dioic acid hydratase in catechol pathway